jgi:hypothetical protein
LDYDAATIRNGGPSNHPPGPARRRPAPVRARLLARDRCARTGAAVEFDLNVDEKRWEKGMDETGKGPLRRQPFTTATFRAAVAIDCQAPTKASIRDSNYGDVIADDSFTAGFASGE